MHLIQSLVRLHAAPRLVLVTRGAQAAGTASSACSAAGVLEAPLWGLAGSVALEQPDLSCTCVDLDPGEQAGLDLLVDELGREGAEPRVSLRGGGAG